MGIFKRATCQTPRNRKKRNQNVQTAKRARATVGFSFIRRFIVSFVADAQSRIVTTDYLVVVTEWRVAAID